MEEECRSCKFFRPRDEDEIETIGHDDKDGKCRRYPAVLITGLHEDHSELICGISGNETDFFEQPYVSDSDWCGEYKPILPGE
jgi:hypothetical protein